MANQVVPIDIVDDTRSLHNIGDFIMSYQPYMNAFLDALVNRIGMVIVTSKTWDNPWAVFKRGMMDMGETVEEIFVNIADVHSYDPDLAETNVFKREKPDVRAAFHSMNWQKFYKVTISNDQLRQAFLSWQGITDLIAKIVDSLYTSMNLDEYLAMKYMMCRALVNGEVYPVETKPIVGDSADPQDSVTKFREYTNNLLFLKSDYNMAGVRNATPIDKQVIIVPNAAEAVIGVDVLANAFNLSQVEYLGRRIPIDSFTFSPEDEARLAEIFANDDTYEPIAGADLTALQSITALKVDEDWWMVFDLYQNMTQQYNGEGLYWNYWLHTWKILSVSPFANAIVFTAQNGSITSVTVTPASANVSQGTSLQLNATVQGTGIYKKTVSWSISGQTKSGTTIGADNGILHVAADEPAETVITVTATAADGKTTKAATITVKASGE